MLQPAEQLACFHAVEEMHTRKACYVSDVLDRNVLKTRTSVTIN
jgi:hypothetical protein